MLKLKNTIWLFVAILKSLENENKIKNKNIKYVLVAVKNIHKISNEFTRVYQKQPQTITHSCIFTTKKGSF